LIKARAGRAGALIGVAAIAVGVAACGGGSTASTGPNGNTQQTGSGIGFQKISLNNSGTAVKGGTLNVLGTGDVDYLDPNITYYTVGYTAAREYSRQLYTYEAVAGHTTDLQTDLATAMPTVSSNGLTYTVTLKQGVMWDTSPARQITGADEVRGIETTCNPSEPWGGLPDIEGLIAGMTQFCTDFAKVSPTPAAITAYENSHSISGVVASKSNPLQVTFTLTHPANYFPNILAIPATSPRPVELNAYLPGSAQEAQHTISDGPYKVASYNPAHTLDFVRNSAWNASTDTVRHAYVDNIDITETGQQESDQQQLQTGSPSADVSFDVGPDPVQANQLLNQNDPNLNVQSAIATDPYLVFNTKSPNNGGALSQVSVRQGLSYAINRNDLVQDAGGPKLNPPLTHILPPQIEGSPPAKDYYPYDPTKAKSMISSVKTITVIYPVAVAISKAMAQDLQSQLGKVGIKVNLEGVPDADFYVKYLEQPTTVAEKGNWDIAITGWFPDWYGNAAQSFFGPLFDGRTFPPNSSNFGLYNDPKVNTLIDQANAAATTAAADKIWAQADNQVMEDAAIFPIADPNLPLYHATQVHNDVYMPALGQFDFTNVWLDPSKNGG
jgi:peptide/nickel transport system substrate-binding protein